MSTGRVIVIIGQYPYEELLKDGMMQRIKEIDILLREHGKLIYLNLSFKKNRSISESKFDHGDIEICANTILHGHLIRTILQRADLVYCHSVMNYIYIAPFSKFCKKIILDLHGVVPEELEMQGKKFASKIFSFVEKMAFRNLKYGVFVSEEMKNFYEKKYANRQSLILPVFSSIENSVAQSDIKVNARYKFVYVGGMQEWQNIDKMIRIAKNYSHIYDFEFYFPQKYISEFSNLGENIKISTASSDQLREIYLSSDFGLILREDSIVNRVASPTKLGEYLDHGLVPVVIQPRIGDFSLKPYNYVRYDDISSIEKINTDDLLNYKINNKIIYDDGKRDTLDLISEFSNIIEKMIRDE